MTVRTSSAATSTVLPRFERRRIRRGRWVREIEIAAAASLFGVIPSLPRVTLARLTTRMIERMDEIDDDPDFEDLREDDEDTHDRENTYD